MILLWLGCFVDPKVGPDDTAAETGDTSHADTTDTADTAHDTAPVDADGDLYPQGVDCDDGDPAVHPGAAEAWNEVDEDCDGRVDADGRYTGDVSVWAEAVYKGRPYRYDLVCPAVLDRAGSLVTWTVTCTPDLTEPKALLLLGETLTAYETGGTATGPTWEGRSDLVSSSGWDTQLDASATWSDFETVTLALAFDGFSLDLVGEGRLGI